MGTITPAMTEARDRSLRERFPYPEEVRGDAEQVLLGSLFGDGCLMRIGPNASPYFTEQHTIPQADYLRWKAEHLRDFRPRLIDVPPSPTGFGKSPQIRLETNRIPAFRGIYQAFYSHGTKVVPEGALALLEPLGLAVWFMDDGSFQKYRHFVLSTDGFTYIEQAQIARWFHNVWEIEPVIDWVKSRHKQCWRLRFRVADSQRLLRIIEPHVHPLFRAKWRLDDPSIWREAVIGSERAILANARRTELIKAGEMTVGYHTGTIRLK